MKLIPQSDVINGKYICLNASYSTDNLYGYFQGSVRAQRFCEEKFKFPRLPSEGFTKYLSIYIIRCCNTPNYKRRSQKSK